jgi:succinyl-CoA synthetase beta subunit
MKIHEYQGKGILKKYGVTVPRGMMATSQEEAEAAARELLSSGATGVVVKAQIHAGGRGKGGGVKIAKSVAEAGEIAGKMLGMKLVTHQTGPEGRTVRRLLIEETFTYRRNSTWESWSIAPKANRSSWLRRRVEWKLSK